MRASQLRTGYTLAKPSVLVLLEQFTTGLRSVAVDAASMQNIQVLESRVDKQDWRSLRSTMSAKLY